MDQQRGSVTGWIKGVRQSDSLSEQKIWEHYYSRLVAYARKKLQSNRRAADEEDVALSALNSFYGAAQANRFPKLDDRDDLWRILMSLTARKAIDANRHEHRAVRGGGKVRGDSALAGNDETKNGGIDWLQGSEPTPDFVVTWNEEFERLLDVLDNDRLRSVAIAKLEGCTNEEIAIQLDCAPRTVVRNLALIRSMWQQTEQNE